MNVKRIRLPLLAALVTAVAAISPAVASAQWFAPNSFWNTPLANSAALDTRSTSWVEHLVSKVNTYGDWINSSQYSVPIYTASASQPTSSVWIDNYALNYQGNFRAVPIPADAQPAAGTDHHMVVYQPSSDNYWEFWNTYQDVAGAWHAGSAAEIASQSGSSGIVPMVVRALFPSPYGATATGLPLAGGLITPAELQSGQIDHAVAIAIPHPLMEWWWSWPAQRSDGDSADNCDIPEGTRFRLPANVNVNGLGLSRTATIIARAVQKYGMVVRDKGGSVAFFAQDPINMGANPYPSLFNHQSPTQVLAGFPWGQLQALQSQPNQTLPNPLSGTCV